MSIVYDFPAIASHLRRDDFFTPTPRAKVDPAGFTCPACFSSNTKFFHSVIPHWHCHDCELNVVATQP